MRVVVVSAWEPWRTSDGAAFVLDHQLRVLAARHDVTLLTAGAPAPTAPPPPTVASSLPGVAVQWYGSGVAPISDHLGRRLWSLRHREPAHVRFVERPGLVAAVERLAPTADLVHLHGWGTAALWQHLSGTPTVHMAIDCWSLNAGNRRLPLARRLSDAGQRRLIAAHEQRHYPMLGAVVVVADRDAAAVRATAPDARVEVVPNGVDAGADPMPAGDRPVLGFHGNFDSQANVDAARSLVNDVLPQVRRSVPDAEVLLVGRRPPRSVQALVGQQVRLRADAPDIRPELAEMAVHVDWFTTGSGIKNKVLEAMAAGRPVVASALAAEGIGAGPGLFVADSVADAAATAAELLADPVAAAAVGRAGRSRVLAEFSWATNAARIESLWTEQAR